MIWMIVEWEIQVQAKPVSPQLPPLPPFFTMALLPKVRLRFLLQIVSIYADMMSIITADNQGTSLATSLDLRCGLPFAVFQIFSITESNLMIYMNSVLWTCWTIATGQETERLIADPAPGISAVPHDDNLRYFDVKIDGPGGSPFEGERLVNLLNVDHGISNSPSSIENENLTFC